LFELSFPAFVAWLVPAAIMSRSLPASVASAPREPPKLERGTLVVMVFLALTIAMAAVAHELLHLPAVVGMMTGLALLAMWGYALKRRELRSHHAEDADFAATALDLDRVLREEARTRRAPLDLYVEVQRADWDTLLYCYGAVLCVGGLSALGYVTLVSDLVHGASAEATETATFALASGAVDNLLGMLFALEMARRWARIRCYSRHSPSGSAGRSSPSDRRRESSRCGGRPRSTPFGRTCDGAGQSRSATPRVSACTRS
jgi:Na+/H+ antiporter NhaD/arsenite permease-like protein